MSEEHEVQVHWHEHAVSRDEREERNGHAGCVVWLTGLSACGKSTVANLVDHRLHSLGVHSFVLDGDNPSRPECRPRHAQGAARRGVCQALRPGLFGPGSRGEHPPHRGRGQAVLPMPESIAITAFISPIGSTAIGSALAGRRRLHRDLRRCPDGGMREPATPGLTKRPGPANSGVSPGIDDPYEAPLKPELVLDAAR